LRSALDAAGLEDLVMSIMVDTSRSTEDLPPVSAPDIAATHESPLVGTPMREPTGPVGLTERYTFDTFVIGSSNRFAHAAALSVAERPARSYNPLFIYGSAGLGKTHLLHAIGHYVLRHYQGNRVRYVATETMLNEFLDAIRSNTTTRFKRDYRDCDVLLVDDIQFIEGKERLQEEFFHTFNHLHGNGRQIVITSDRLPDAIPTLEDRLRSRFKWGLMTDVQPPELETRLAILRNKAEQDPVAIDDDVLELIAERITENIRELEGALIRVSAFASLNREPVTVTLAEKVLSDVLVDSDPRQITPDDILDATSAMFGFTIDDLMGPSRRRPLVQARQVGMYVFRQVTEFSYPMIGREFGNRDHTTVMHAVEKVTNQMKEQRQVYDQVTRLIHTIKIRNDPRRSGRGRDGGKPADASAGSVDGDTVW
jgi:chromosomal replication initiator protein